jgi:Zn-finger nucleic acid-binding protein
MCPTSNASMTEVRRNDVALDMCPTCRGVWLDRGELEKLIEGARGELQAFEQERREFRRDPQGYQQRYPQDFSAERGEHGERGERGERGEHGSYDSRTARRRRGFDFLDIFD